VIPVVAALATQHGKELLFAPSLATIGISVVVAPVNTDEFGTFSGEVERVGSAEQIVEQKARSAAATTGLTIGLASEGSFGPHPQAPFVLIDTELVAYVDVATDHLIIEGATNISSVPRAQAVAQADHVADLKIAQLFPEQAAIIVIEESKTKIRTVIAKEVRDLPSLEEAIREAFQRGSGAVIVEPDLRAHCCPDRRKVIQKAVDQLTRRLAQRCPSCNAPGLGTLRKIPGLPCQLCELPTTQTAADVIGCTRCGYEHTSFCTNQADPTFCDRCNP